MKNFWILACCVAALATACSKDPGNPSIVLTLAGDGALEEAGTIAASPLRLRVQRGDSPVVGATVTWAAGGGTTLSTLQTTTDSDGWAETIVTLDPVAGVNLVTAVVVDPSASASFTTTGYAVVEEIFPMFAAVGADIEIRGHGFSSTLSDHVVTFGTTQATVLAADFGRLVVTAP